MKKLTLKLVIWGGVIALAYFGLFGNITNEIAVRGDMDIRKAENIQRLKDLREIQLQYKRSKGYYAENLDSLYEFLYNGQIEFINTDKADNDSIPADLRKWKQIQKRMLSSARKRLNVGSISKRIYKEGGGKWKKLTEEEKIEKGYISVTYFKASDLTITEEYKKIRSENYKINIPSFNNIRTIYKEQESKSSFGSQWTDEAYNNIGVNPIYIEIKKEYDKIFTRPLLFETLYIEWDYKFWIQENKNKIKELNENITLNTSNESTANIMVDSIMIARQNYIESIGENQILKVKEKAQKKAEKGKKLKGRKAIIYKTITDQDSIENANNIIIENSLYNIDLAQKEIQDREKLISAIEKHTQCILDLQQMQLKYLDLNINNDSLDLAQNINSLLEYMNEEIKIVTTLKKGKYTIPSDPELWEESQMKAEILVEQSMGEDIKEKINKKYQEAKGEFRSLTFEEAKARGLVTIVAKPVQDVIFNDIYIKNRDQNVAPLKIDSLFYIPHTEKKYTFLAKRKYATNEEKAQGEIDKYFFEISAEYHDVFKGLDDEYVTLRRFGEKGKMSVGSLEKTITNGNWGE